VPIVPNFLPSCTRCRAIYHRVNEAAKVNRTRYRLLSCGALLATHYMDIAEIRLHGFLRLAVMGTKQPRQIWRRAPHAA
jgi:hypothetical protein